MGQTKMKMVGVIVVAVLLVAGAAMAQTVGPSVEPASRGIIPVTGPSTVPVLPEPAKAEVVSAVAQGEGANAEGVRQSTTGRPPAATATRPAPRTVKAVHKPVAKTTVKTTSGAKHVAKATGTQKATHVTAVKHQPPVRHAAVGKPIPLAKHQPPAKGAPPAQPVLPRV